MEFARHGSAAHKRAPQMPLILLNLTQPPPGFATLRGFNHNHGVKTVLEFRPNHDRLPSSPPRKA